MYTPRQSSLSRAQSSLDPATGIRVVIQPSQSSYFAGEPFTCIVTFTNTRSVVPSTHTRALSASFSPGHKRAAHSVSSAPLSRPPTSPGTPKTAQPFVTLQTREGDAEDKVRRRGLIGRPMTAATAALDKKRRMPARSLSVDITPQDIIKRLVDPGSPTPNSILRTQSERASPTSPRVSSPLAREHINALPPSHPHARKHSVVSDDLTSPQSPSSSEASPFPPATPSAAPAFQLSLDPITENGTNSPTPTASAFSSPFPSATSLIQPAPSPQPRGNRPGHTRRPSNLGLGLPLAVPGTTTDNGHVKSVGAHPPRSAFSATFLPPSTELLLYAYAQLTGTLTIDATAVPTSPEQFTLRAALRKRTAVGGGSLDIGSGTHRPRSSSTSSFFGFLSSPTPTSPGPNSPGMLSSFLSGGPSVNTNGEAADEPLPTLETQPSMLAIDLSLAAGESRSYSYSLPLPANLPPTFKGRALRFSYQLVVGTCRASSPLELTSPGQHPSSPLPSPGVFGDSERRRSRVMRVPIRVYSHVAVGRAPRPYDLLWPVARRREQADPGRVEEVRSDKGVATRSKPMGSLASVQGYAQRLIAGEGDLDLESPAGETGEGGALSGCREAVEITTRNPKKVSYDVSKDGEKVAVLTFVKSAYRLGETVLGIVELNEGHCRSKVLKLSAMLEAHESLPWPGAPLRRVHAEHHSSLVTDMRRVAFALDIPSDASPAFEVAQEPGGSMGGLEWKVRMCLLVSMATGGGRGSTKGKGRAVEVRGLVRDGPAGEWGTSWRASESIAPMERVRVVPEPTPRKSSSSWTAIFSPFAGGTYHDADEEGEDEEDDGEWAEMSAETVECMVPLRVFAGNTAFRAVEVAFDV